MASEGPHRDRKPGVGHAEMKTDFDLIVSGGSTAGMAAAIHAALCGLKVLVFDAAGRNYDKPCGEGLMPLARRHLHSLGVRMPETYPLAGIIYIRNKRRIQSRFVGECGFGIRRLALRQNLWLRAVELGVAIREEAVRHVEDRNTYVDVNGVTALHCIIAEGIHSQTVRKMGLKKARSRHNRFGLRLHIDAKPWSDFVEVWWGDDFEVYVTPVAHHTINIALLANRAMSLEGALKVLPELNERVASSRILQKASGAGPLLHRTTHRRRGRVLIAGDAAGFVDAMTGEGNTLALGSGIAASRAVVSGRLWLYPYAWWLVVWRYWFLTRPAAGIAVRPRFRTLVLGMIYRAPVLLQWGLRFLSKT